MQAYSDLKLKCVDCKNTLSSAALLLKHFAQHITEQHEVERKSSGKRLYPHNNMASKKKKKNKSILESVLKVSNVSIHSSSEQSPSAGTDSSTASAFSDYQESSSDNSTVTQNIIPCSKIENNTALSDDNVESDNKLPLSLVRFDLQKRLESCVMNLSSKKRVNINNNISDTQNLEICQKIKQEIKIEDEKCEKNSSNGTNEEFNPIKFCMITMADNKECVKEIMKESKKMTSRKQLIPKKIEKDLRKIAPKPNDAPKIQDSSSNKSIQKKKYPCHLCSKVFGWSTDLKRHILVHTGERPFKCKTCLASFTRNFLLQKHQSKVHPCSPPKKTQPLIVPVIENMIVQNIKTENSVTIKIEKCESEDDEDDEKLVITESFEEEDNSQLDFKSTIETKWLKINSPSERCSDYSDRFSSGQMNVVTM
uniref:C2H2-type domain-containing protein n=1 Tax=Clastoptera arizonana TaxID=38151 RepID=A0A1B6DWL2_9HEMI